MSRRNRSEHPSLRKRAIETVDLLLSEDLFTPTSKQNRPFKTAYIEDGAGKYHYVDTRWHIDHAYVDDEGFMTQHPYSVNMEKLKEVIAWCDEHEYTFSIDAASAYFPAHTIRIRFHRKDEDGPHYVHPRKVMQ